MKLMFTLALALFCACTPRAFAEDLFQNQPWANVASDRRASAVGDVLTVVVYQNAEARNAAQNNAHKRHAFAGSVQAGTTDESAELSLDGVYDGQGEVRRSESFITQISVSIESVLPNGDYQIAGQQHMFINGERTLINIRGRVRAVDISAENQVLSTRIADAQIDYDGHGFVSRNARAGLLQNIFGLLGLGG